MAPKVKAKAAPKIAPIPAVHSFPQINALPDGMDLRDAIEKGYAEGLSRREQVRENVDKPYYLADLLQEPDTIRQIAELAKGYGATKFAPLARGAESSVFASDSPKVFKIGPQTGRFERFEPYDYELPGGVWGVLPNERAHIVSPDNDWNVFAQDRVSTDDVDMRDVRLVLDALNQQGYGARDAHDQNVGKIPGKAYKPVLYDGYVYQRPTRTDAAGRIVDEATGLPILGRQNFRPPTTRPWVLAALATGAAGAAGTANASTREQRNKELEQFLAPEGRAPVPWSPSPGDVGALERYTGSDWDMAVSPREYHSWYTNPESGYGGPEHQQFIANFEEAMDQPAIPEQMVRAQIGGIMDVASAVPGYKGGDMTMRQYIKAVPHILQAQAFMAYAQDPTPENRSRYISVASVNQKTPPGSGSNPIEADVYAEMTGQRYNRGVAHGAEGAELVRSAIHSGTRGNQFAEDNTVPQSQYEAWQRGYGSEADRMLPPGAETNAMRDRVYDLATTMSDSPNHPARGIDSISAAMMRPFKPTEDEDPTGNRYANLMDRSAPRGRMAISSERWNLGRPKNDGKPYVVDADAFGRYDPQSFGGLRNVLGNASFPISAAQQAWYPMFGDIGSQIVLQDGLGDTKPRQFIGDTSSNQSRVSQIRPDNVRPQDARETEDWWNRWQNASGDYWSATVGPRVFNSYFSPALNDVVNTPQDTAKSAIQTGMSLIPGLSAVAKGAPAMAGRAVLANAADEIVENMYESPILDPKNAGKYFSAADENSYLRRPVDVKDGEAYEKEIAGSSDEWNWDLGREYAKWNRQENSTDEPQQSLYHSSPSRATLIPMLRR